MQTTTGSLMVQDILSVFSEPSPSNRTLDEQVYVELLTSDGLMILKMHPLMARELMESLSRTFEEFGARL
ncbi:MAG TPA: hypothetical protein VMG55_14535 [Stellaceae bacterium]|nr:hypothetical protein [Stellaceae bacterium]